MSFIVLLICFCLPITKMRITNSHFKFGRSESRGVVLMQLQLSFLTSLPAQHSSTVGPQPMWASATVGSRHLQHNKSHSTAPGTRTKAAGGQAATSPGHMTLPHPKSMPLASNNPPQQRAKPRAGVPSPPLPWGSSAGPGLPRFSPARALNPLCNCGSAGGGEAILHAPHGL